MQGIHRRLRLSLERAAGPSDLRDCSGKILRVEPLVPIDSLEKFLNGIVSEGRVVYCWEVVALQSILYLIAPIERMWIRGKGDVMSGLMENNVVAKQSGSVLYIHSMCVY